MKRLVVLVFILHVSLSGCASSRDRSVFRWGGDCSGGEPFLIDRSPDEPGGFEAEIAQYLGQKIGRKPIFQQRDWPNLPQDLQRGDIDAAFNGMEWLPEREKMMASTIPYFQYGLRLIVRKDSPIQSWQDLRRAKEKGRIRAGVLKDSVAHRYLEAEFADQIEILASDVDGVTGVMNNVVADPLYVTVQDAPAATWYLERSRVKEQYRTLHAVDAVIRPGDYPYYVIYVRKEDTALREALNAAIRAGLSDGTFRRIYEKYGLWDAEQEKLLAVGDSWPPEVQTEARSLLFFAGQMLLAARYTILLAVWSFPLAMLLGVLLALAREYGPWWLSGLSLLYVELFRGTPLLLQLVVIYYFLPVVGLVLPALVAGILGLGLNYAACEAEVFRAGLKAVPRGQTEAALALGMSSSTTIWRIVLPQAWKIVIPPVTNDFIALFKDTAVCSAIAVMELTAKYRSFVNANPDQVVQLGLLAAAMYLAMSYPLSVLARRLEVNQARGPIHS
ncbi:MAG: ABC transporter permease subunit [Gemmataceae bacterium]